jgi:hypothetical protein
MMRITFAVVWIAVVGCTDHSGAVSRQLVTRSLMPTSANNLLRDPLIGGDGSPSWGQFRAFYEDGDDVAITRTFVSTSPVAGAVSIEELRDYPPAGTATTIAFMGSFLGTTGTVDASIWLSAGDSNADPVAFATASSAITVSLLANDGSTVSTLVASPVQAYGSRQWVRYTTAGDLVEPAGGWLMVELSDLSYSLQLAAPEVLTTELGASPINRTAPVLAVGVRQRAALAQARRIDERQQRPRRRPEARDLR